MSYDIGIEDKDRPGGRKGREIMGIDFMIHSKLLEVEQLKEEYEDALRLTERFKKLSDQTQSRAERLNNEISVRLREVYELERSKQ